MLRLKNLFGACRTPCMMVQDSALSNVRLCSDISKAFDKEIPSKIVESHVKDLKVPVPTNFNLKKYNKPLLPTHNLAAYADSVPVLQKLIELGVEIYRFDSQPQVCQKILVSDFDKDLKPYLKFLLSVGVPAVSIGKFISNNPQIFNDDLDHLNARINYLRSKKFTKKMIVEILTKQPKFLSLPVRVVDRRLGLIQSSLGLTGDQVRHIVFSCPKVARMHDDLLIHNIHTLKEQIGIGEDVKETIVKLPLILTRNNHDIVKSCYYVQKVMHVPLHLILKQPDILNSRPHKIQERHQFLVKLGRAQYNPDLPGYISLSSLANCNDEHFAKNVARSSIEVFNDYLKIL